MLLYLDIKMTVYVTGYTGCALTRSLSLLYRMRRAYATFPRDAKHDEEIEITKRFIHDLPHDGKIFSRDACAITFNRASGPGGQNVNK